MTNRRTRKAVVYRCDFPGCKGSHTAPTPDYRLAWQNAKSAGWYTLQYNGRWFHFCMWVHYPKDDQLPAIYAAATTPAVSRAS